MKLLKRHHIDIKGLPVLTSRSRWTGIVFWTIVVTVLLIIKTNITLLGTPLDLTVVIPFYFGM